MRDTLYNQFAYIEKVRRMKIKPSINTAVRAICQLYPIVSTTVKAKKLFSPMPGAWAIGRFGKKAIKSVPIIVARAVVVNRADLSIPVALRILGLTAKI